jgi:hypothetical protein
MVCQSVQVAIALKIHMFLIWMKRKDCDDVNLSAGFYTVYGRLPEGEAAEDTPF